MGSSEFFIVAAFGVSPFRSSGADQAEPHDEHAARLHELTAR